MDAMHAILKDREENMWQIALCHVLFEAQIMEHRHFHMEQPEGSVMLQHPPFIQMSNFARKCRFDLCKVGDLRDPQSQLLMRKRLNVMTTSKGLYESLNDRACTGDHEHQQVAGSTWDPLENKFIQRSKYTERYPRKFARQIIQVLKSLKGRQVLVLAGAAEEEHPTERRRIDSKASPLAIALRSPEVTWDNVMAEVDRIAKRVGLLVVQHGDLIQAVQTLCPDKEVNHLVLCRGTDRMMGPSKAMRPGEAPLRRMVCIRRRFEDVFVEPEWERWENMSYIGNFEEQEHQQDAI